MSTEEQPMITVEGLYKSFKLPHEQHSGIKQAIINFAKQKKGFEVQHVLDDVSFEIKKGEFFGIVGRNGSGKSTLLKLLAGIYAPDRGVVHVNGSLTPFIELGVGFNPELTGRENVFLNGALLGFGRDEMEEMYGDIVSFAELSRFMDQKLKNYSSGMQVRLAFSIAIRAQSDILLIDEVLAVGDASFQQKCFDYFDSLRDAGRTMVLVTHDMSAVKRFCTKAIYISKGKLIKYGEPAEIADIYSMDNVETSEKILSDNVKLSKNHEVSLKINSQTDNNLEVGFSYRSTSSNNLHIAISLIKDGSSVAEITSGNKITLKSSGDLSYTFDTTLLNAGTYQVTAILRELPSRKLLTIASNKINFIIKGEDIDRGGALKLADTWKQEKA